MKKYQLILISSLATLLVACSQKPQDPYEQFRKISSKALFAKADKELSKKNYQTAIAQFEALDALYPFDADARQGQLEVIYAYYKNNDIPSAIAAADRYVRLYPRSKHLDYAYYMRGLAGFQLGMSWLQRLADVSPASRDVSTLKQSFSSFQTLTSHYPHSAYAPDALVRMSYIRNLLANREVAIARNYVQRSAFVAAANRASYVVEHFQGTSAVADALVIMVKSYRKLGMSKMAGDSYKILAKNYPESPQLRSL